VAHARHSSVSERYPIATELRGAPGKSHRGVLQSRYGVTLDQPGTRLLFIHSRQNAADRSFEVDSADGDDNRMDVGVLGDCMLSGIRSLIR
jgi:hypothetical protein